MEKKFSYLWNFFLISDAEAGKAVCYLCNHTLSYKTTITNLKKHLQSRHPQVQIQPSSVVIQEDIAEILNRSVENRIMPADKSEAIRTPVKRSSESSNDSSIVKLKKVEQDYTFPRKMSSQLKKSIDNHLLSLFTKDFHKLSLVEDSGFQSLVSALNPQYEIPDLKTISDALLPELYEKLKQHVEDALQDGLSITLAVDSWTSNNIEQFISVKAHFLTQNFDSASVFLDCYSFSEQPTTERLNEVLKNITGEWGITEKITLLVSNTVFEQTSEEPLHWDYINCVVQTINVIVANSLELVSSLLLKVQCIVSCYVQNKLASSELMRNQENLGITSEELILSNTRDWYSIFSMLRRFVDLEDFIKTTLCHLDTSVTFLTKEEWVICREIVTVIKPFETFMKSLSEEKYISSSLGIILSKGLETMLRELSQKPFHTITQSVLAKCIQETVDQFSYMYTNDILLISTFLDPRFKDVIFEPNIRENLKQRIISIVSTNIHQHSEQNISKSDGNTLKDDTLSIWKAFQAKASEFRPTGKKDSTASRASIEIQQYLEDGFLPRNENPLQWWKINGHMYPHLKNLMKQNLAITCTAASYEQYFSKSSQILKERRSNLSVEEAKLILFINSNDYLMKIND